MGSSLQCPQYLQTVTTCVLKDLLNWISITMPTVVTVITVATYVMSEQIPSTFFGGCIRTCSLRIIITVLKVSTDIGMAYRLNSQAGQFESRWPSVVAINQFRNQWQSMEYSSCQEYYEPRTKAWVNCSELKGMCT